MRPLGQRTAQPFPATCTHSSWVQRSDGSHASRDFGSHRFNTPLRRTCCEPKRGVELGRTKGHRQYATPQEHRAKHTIARALLYVQATKNIGVRYANLEGGVPPDCLQGRRYHHGVAAVSPPLPPLSSRQFLRINRARGGWSVTVATVAMRSP
jgi:hypothetical protein